MAFACSTISHQPREIPKAVITWSNGTRTRKTENCNIIINPITKYLYKVFLLIFFVDSNVVNARLATKKSSKWNGRDQVPVEIKTKNKQFHYDSCEENCHIEKKKKFIPLRWIGRRWTWNSASDLDWRATPGWFEGYSCFCFPLQVSNEQWMGFSTSCDRSRNHSL